MPNFWGCRCCKSGRVAYMSGAARYVMVKVSSGQTVFPIVSGSLIDNGIWSDIVFLTKDRVVMKTQTSYAIYEKEDLLLTGSFSDSGGTISKNADEFLITANESGSPSGRFRPFKCDYDGNVTLTIEQDATLTASPSTIVPLFRTNNPETSSAIDSTGACYFAGWPWANSSNQSGLWKFDADGNVEWTVNTMDTAPNPLPCGLLAVDSEDNVYFTRNFMSGSSQRPVLYKMDPDGNELWTMDFDYSTVPYVQYGVPICKKPIIDNDGGWIYINQSEVVPSAPNTVKIRRYSLETGEKDESYDPYYWPLISEFRIEKRTGDIIALPQETSNNLIRYAASDGELKWGHGMNSGGYVSHSLDLWQE